MAATAIAMPRLGMTMEEGTVVEWPVPLGAAVLKGQIVLVIETEKAESEIEATASGVFRHVFVEPGETVACGALLAVLTDGAGEAFDPEAFRQAYLPPEGSVLEDEQEALSPAQAQAPAPAVRDRGARRAVAPAARALARKLEVDLDSVPGSGPGGRVTKQDVEAAAAARSRLFEVEPGIGLEVLRQGQGGGEGAPVLLLPGFGSDLSSFALQVPRLAERWALIGLNPRGVGASDAPDDEVYDVERAAQDAAAVLADGPPAHVVGASLGAAAALELALQRPERIRSLTLMTPFVVARPRLLAFADAWAAIARGGDAEAIAAFLAPWLFGDRLLGDEARRARTLRGLAQSVRRTLPATLTRSAAGMRAWSGTRSADLGKLAVPTLVLAAGDDLLTPEAEAVASAIPGAVCETLPGSGHALAIDAAEEVSRLLEEHLSRASG